MLRIMNRNASGLAIRIGNSADNFARQPVLNSAYLPFMPLGTYNLTAFQSFNGTSAFKSSEVTGTTNTPLGQLPDPP
jgi:hypothetical protein